MKADALKTVKVSDITHQRLTRLGDWGESMDKIIARLLDDYERKNGGYATIKYNDRENTSS